MMSNDETFLDYWQGKAEKEDEWSKNRIVKEGLKTCGKLLANGSDEAYSYVVQICVEEIDKYLIQQGELNSIDYERRLHGKDDFNWTDWMSVRDNPERVLNRLNEEEYSFSNYEITTLPRDTIENALDTYGVIAAYEGIIPEEMRDRADATGYATKVGEHLQSKEWDLSDSVSTVTNDTGALKTIHVGGTGAGKSNGVDVEVWDYYSRSRGEGREFKIIDVYGFDFENIYYDVSQQQQPLLDARSDMGLSETIDSPDLPTPEMEIYHPLTPDLTQQELPFNTETETFTVKPYVVPAYELPIDVLIDFLGARLTPQQTASISLAVEEVAKDDPKYSLDDIAQHIKSDDEIDQTVQSRAVKSLESLSRQGWIATGSEEHTLNLDEIMRDTDTITVFSQAFMSDKTRKLMAIAHLIDAIPSQRQEHAYDEAVVVMRELHETCPHSRRTAANENAAAIQTSIAGKMSDTFRKNRHTGTHLLTDTQKIGDIDISVREMFNRYVVYSEKRDAVKDMANYTGTDEWKSFYKSLNLQTGIAGILGKTGATLSHGIDYLSPVKYTGAPFHHWDEKTDQGLTKSRTQYVENEEPRTPDEEGTEWHTNTDNISTNKTETGIDIELNPVKAFVTERIEQDTSSDLEKETMRSAYNQYREDHGLDTIEWTQSNVTSVSMALKTTMESVFQETIETIDNHPRRFKGVTLT